MARQIQEGEREKKDRRFFVPTLLKDVVLSCEWHRLVLFLCGLMEASQKQTSVFSLGFVSSAGNHPFKAHQRYLILLYSVVKRTHTVCHCLGSWLIT